MAFLIALSVTATTPGCTDPIVQNGRSRARILIDANAPTEVTRAARELQSYFLRTSGAELPIATAATPPLKDKDVEIRLRVGSVAPAGDPRTQLVHEDGYRIESGGRAITITGGSPRGTLYGVYAFIERVLGVRWFMPTALGEDIREAKTIPMPTMNVVKNPAFPSISGFIWAGSPGAEDWELRMRVRVGTPVAFGHNWYNILPFSKEAFEKNPELFALVGGKRGQSSQLCTTHPEVIRASIEAARRHFDAQPDSPLFSISPNDGMGLCECDRCRALDAHYGAPVGSRSDRFTHYANEVIKGLETSHPGKEVGILAYSEYTVPPVSARPRPEYATLVTHMPWEFCHAHAIDDPRCPSNQRYLSYLKGWAALTKHVGVYEYYGHFFAFTPWPIVHSIRRDIPLFAGLGIERFISETQQNWANQGINFYVAAKLADDPSVNVDTLLAEYFSRFYGAAAAPMRGYFDLWETAMQDTTVAGDRGYAWLSIFTPTRVAEADALLKEAERLAGGGAEKFRARVAFARLGFGYTEAFAKMLDAGIRKDVRGVLQWSDEAQRRVKATEGSAPQAFFVSVAIDQTRYMARILAEGVPPWVALKPYP